jgi:hypothetical protein
MAEEFEVLKQVTQRLNDADIIYFISGSIASNYYTQPRMTRDIDIVIDLSSRDINRFVALFQNDFYIDQEMIKHEVARVGLFNLIHKQYIIKIDFILKKETEYQKSTFARRKKVMINDQAAWIIAPEDLIISKLIWAKETHSAMQLADVKNLLSMELDKSYLEHWIQKLELIDIYKEALL